LTARLALAPSYFLAALVKYSHRVHRRDAQIDAHQPSQPWSPSAGSVLEPQPRRLRSDGDAHGDGSQGGEPDNGSHSCAATRPDLKASAHFPHPGHPWPGQRRQSSGRGSPSDKHSSPPTGPAGMLTQPWNPASGEPDADQTPVSSLHDNRHRDTPPQ
jgi:hypothetical protein